MDVVNRQWGGIATVDGLLLWLRPRDEGERQPLLMRLQDKGEGPAPFNKVTSRYQPAAAKVIA